MTSLNIPDGYQAIMPYLILNNAETFLQFAKEVFNAEEKMKVMRDGQYIMHGEIIMHGSTIMFAASTPEYAPQNAGLFIYVPDADECYHKALEAGASSVMPLSDQPYGRTCGVKDPTGNTWWITSVQKQAHQP